MSLSTTATTLVPRQGRAAPQRALTAAVLLIEELG